VNAKLFGRVAIGLLYVFASPIYVLRWVLRTRKSIAKMAAIRGGVVTCPHCGFHNNLDALMTCRRCGATEFGSRIYCTSCRQLSKAFACDRCTATIKVL